MEVENGSLGNQNYLALLEEARRRLPEGTDAQTVRRTAWLYTQYGCNNYTDGPGYPFRPEDVQDAVSLSKREGMEFARLQERLGILKMGAYGRYSFAERWR